MIEISAIGGDKGLTKDERYERAQELDVDGRSPLNKKELKEAIIEKYTSTSS